ncbi:MAG: histidine kinase [Arenimonas sp.]
MIEWLKSWREDRRPPPLKWALAFALGQLLFTHFGFYHWLIQAGLMFAVLWVRPGREFPVWYAVNTACFTLNAWKNLWLRGQPDMPFLGLWPSLELFLLGTMAMPPLVYAAVRFLKARGIRPQDGNGFRGMSYLLGSGLLAALLLTAKDVAYVLTDGKISEVKAGRIIGTEALSLSNAVELLGSFVISHFMGAFIGIMIVAPLVMWIAVPAFRAGSGHLLKRAALTLLPVAALISVALFNSHESRFFGLLQVLMLAAVVVFSFFHGWRGAAVSVVLVSLMISVDNHLDPLSGDPKQMQLYVSIVGALALLFGAAMDELKTREADLEQRQAELYRASMQKQQLLDQLVDASRRSMQAQDAERQRIALELHDEIGQSITALQIHLNLLQVELHQQGKAVLAGRLTGIAEKIGEGVRGVVMDLAPIELAELGLYMALAHGSSARTARQAGLQYDVRFRGRIDELDHLHASTALAAYRIVQESLTNVVKHAHAASCRVTLALRQRHGEWLLFVTVQDDGVGLARGVKAERCFVSIRDRALALSGRLHVRSRYGLRIHVLLRQPAAVTGNRRDRRRPTSASSAPI